MIRRYLSTTLILIGLCTLYLAWVIAGNPKVGDETVTAVLVAGIGLVSAGFFTMSKEW